MIEQSFRQIYTKFKLHFYQQIFSASEKEENPLTTMESFCMEVILALGEPTVAEFSRTMKLSTPNAAYKISSLVNKGYLEKIRSEQDRREYHLRPTAQYLDYYNTSYGYMNTIVERARELFPKEDVDKLDEMLSRICDEIMSEVG